MDTNSRGFVYVILDTSDNSRKLGFSIDVDRRLREEQTGNAHTLKIEYRLPVINMRKAEKSLHLLFAAKRTRRGKGEWFLLDEKDIVLLKKIFKAQDITTIEYTQLESLGLR